jgi:hypothetical protein
VKLKGDGIPVCVANGTASDGMQVLPTDTPSCSVVEVNSVVPTVVTCAGVPSAGAGDTLTDADIALTLAGSERATTAGRTTTNVRKPLRLAPKRAPRGQLRCVTPISRLR